MIKYFPFTSDFNLKMGTTPMLANETVVETDEHYLHEIQLKRKLLAEDYHYYFDALPESKLAQWETVEVVLNDLVKHDPQNFSLQKENARWQFINKKLNENFSFEFDPDSYRDENSLPVAPLDFVGRQVQEDLILLNNKNEVVAGQLCFPSGWALQEKIGEHFLEVHAPLPSVTNSMIQSANKFIEKIPVGKSFSRNNWGFRLGNELDLSSKHSLAYRESLKAIPQLSQEEFGEKIFLRVEHQTLTRLPKSNFILFTIHTYNSSLKDETVSQERTKTMLSFLKDVPAELIEYKVLTPIYDKLIEYLS